MTEREKLTEILNDIQQNGNDFWDVEIYGMRIPDTVSNEDVADHLLTNGVTVQKWIPVSERMPEKDVEVLVFNGHGIYVSQFYTWHAGSIGIDSWLMPQYCADPTHWMPLPEPPKEEA